MTIKAVLLDTSFFIRLLNPVDPLADNAEAFFRYFLDNDWVMMTSTVAVAEFCVKGKLSALPTKDLLILPFNLEHARKAASFARLVFAHKAKLQNVSRLVIPNDTKLFAQAQTEKAVIAYLSSDAESKKIYNLLQEYTAVNFSFLDLNAPFEEAAPFLA